MDICACTGEGCPKRSTCYRFRCLIEELAQTYFSEPPYKDGECDRYWEVKPCHKTRTLDEIEKNPLL